MVERFGPGVRQGSAGGTGIAIHEDGLYAEQNDKIVRYPLSDGEVVPKEPPQIIVSGLPLTGHHPMHPFIIDPDGHLYVDLGSATNSCQIQNRTLDLPGHQPCTELETRAGIWRYEANKKISVSRRPSAMPPDCATARALPSMRGPPVRDPHGRDQLQQNWPNSIPRSKRP